MPSLLQIDFPMTILKYLYSKINSIVECCFEMHRLYIILLFLLTGCMSQQDRLHKKLSKEDPKNINYQGHYKIGKEYSIKGSSYIPEKNIKYDQIGVASWYGSKHGFHGKNTANGDRYNKYTLTAAHTTLPLPSLIKVTNLENNKSVILMVNDRGPFSKNRILDVSETAAHVLSFKRQGTAKVRVQYMHKETQDFLKKIALNPKEGSRTAHKTKSKHCSINCHVKLVNLKYNLAITP
jgi:rare lipoprotein A